MLPRFKMHETLKIPAPKLRQKADNIDKDIGSDLKIDCAIVLQFEMIHTIYGHLDVYFILCKIDGRLATIAHDVK